MNIKAECAERLRLLGAPQNIIEDFVERDIVKLFFFSGSTIKQPVKDAFTAWAEDVRATLEAQKLYASYMTLGFLDSPTVFRCYFLGVPYNDNCEFGSPEYYQQHIAKERKCAKENRAIAYEMRLSIADQPDNLPQNDFHIIDISGLFR